MAFKKMFYSISLSATFAFAAVCAVDFVTSSEEATKNKISNLEAFRNLAANINSFHDANLVTNEVIHPEELVIASISKDLDRSIKKQKNLVAKHLEKNQFKKIVQQDRVDYKLSAPVREVKKIKIINEEQSDLSIYEINNKELVHLSAFSFEKVALVKFDLLSIEEFETDKVELALSAVEKSGPIGPTTQVAEKDEEKNLTTQSETAAEEMPMFEYSKPEVDKKFDKKLYERPISKTVLKAIHREMGSVHKLNYEQVNKKVQLDLEPESEALTQNTIEGIPTIKEAEQLIGEKNNVNESSSEDQVSFDYSSVDKKIVKEQSASSALTSTKKQTEVTIQTLNVAMSTQKRSRGYSFEFLPDYDRSERNYDQGSGEVKVGYVATENTDTITGTVEARGMIPTRVELVMDTHNQIVPLFEDETFHQYMDVKGVSNQTSILLSLPADVKDVEIDSSYESKVILDKNFKETEKAKQFIMFMGVKPGNILVKYRLENSTAEKIVFVGDGEIFFEEPVFEQGERETLELTTRNLLSNKQKELNLDQSAVKVFNTNVTAKKLALNAYELKMPTQIVGSRKYFEIITSENTIFVGKNQESKIEVPNIDFVKKILDFNEVTSLDNRCLVQVNNRREISDIKIGGKNISGDMYLETSYLDQEGNLTKENPEHAEKLFVLGENEGIINLLINYADGSSESVKTLCSNGTYLIEQL